MPKSVSFTAPERSMSTLPGDTSRCTSESGLPSSSRAPCAYSSARRTESAMWRQTSSGRSSPCAGGADEARARRPVDVLHRHVELAVLLAEVEHLHDVRVAQARADARLVDEHRDEVGSRATAAGCA
jgi:hypothetical protein